MLKQQQGHTDNTQQLTLTLHTYTHTRVIYTLPHYIYTQHAHTDIIYCNTSAYTDTHQVTHSDNTQTHTDSTPMYQHTAAHQLTLTTYNTSAYTDTHQVTHSDNTQTHTDSAPMCTHCHTLPHAKHTESLLVQLQKAKSTNLISLSCRVAE